MLGVQRSASNAVSHQLSSLSLSPSLCSIVNKLDNSSTSNNSSGDCLDGATKTSSAMTMMHNQQHHHRRLDIVKKRASIFEPDNSDTDNTTTKQQRSTRQHDLNNAKLLKSGKDRMDASQQKRKQHPFSLTNHKNKLSLTTTSSNNSSEVSSDTNVSPILGGGQQGIKSQDYNRLARHPAIVLTTSDDDEIELTYDPVTASINKDNSTVLTEGNFSANPPPNNHQDHEHKNHDHASINPGYSANKSAIKAEDYFHPTTSHHQNQDIDQPQPVECNGNNADNYAIEIGPELQIGESAGGNNMMPSPRGNGSYVPAVQRGAVAEDRGYWGGPPHLGPADANAAGLGAVQRGVLQISGPGAVHANNKLVVEERKVSVEEASAATTTGGTGGEDELRTEDEMDSQISRQSSVEDSRVSGY